MRVLLLTLLLAGCSTDRCNDIYAEKDCEAQCGALGCETDPVCEDGEFVFTCGSSLDLSGDMTALSCAGYVQCVIECGGHEANCPQCATYLTNPARQLVIAADDCAKAVCNTGADGGAPPCSGMTPACSDCVDEAESGLFSRPCSDPSSPYCNPPACAVDYARCLAN